MLNSEFLLIVEIFNMSFLDRGKQRPRRQQKASIKRYTLNDLSKVPLLRHRSERSLTLPVLPSTQSSKTIIKFYHLRHCPLISSDSLEGRNKILLNDLPSHCWPLLLKSFQFRITLSMSSMVIDTDVIRTQETPDSYNYAIICFT